MEDVAVGMVVLHRATDEPMFVLDFVDVAITDTTSEQMAKVRRAVQTRDLGIQYRTDTFRMDELYTPLDRAREDMHYAKALAALRDELTEKKGPTLLQ